MRNMLMCAKYRATNRAENLGEERDLFIGGGTLRATFTFMPFFRHLYSKRLTTEQFWGCSNAQD